MTKNKREIDLIILQGDVFWGENNVIIIESAH